MGDVAILAEGLGKLYRIGRREAYCTLRDTITRSLAVSFRRLRNRRHPVTDGGHSPLIWALKDVSFEIKKGEVVGVIGRNGAGKSTLLKILSSITEPTEGQVTIHGRVGSLLEVGTGFHPELTGRENIYLNGAILGMKKKEIECNFDEIVAFAEIEKFLDMPVKHYSSGMYMRLAFSVAAHLEPEVLLVDEVLAVGDAAFQRKCLGRMGAVAKEGRTVLFVSHNMSAVLNLCSRTLVVKDGGLLADCATDEAVNRYLGGLHIETDGDLTSCVSRDGSGHVRFSRVWFEDEQGHVMDQPMSGQTVVIVLLYESRFQDSLSNCRVSVAFENLYGQPLFLCSTELVATQRTDLPPSGIVRCVIPDFPLSRGEYRLTFFLEVNHEVADWLKAAVTLSVVDGDFFGSGRQYPDGWQGKTVLVPHRWTITVGS